jgi:hypothetical protein
LRVARFAYRPVRIALNELGIHYEEIAYKKEEEWEE